MARFNVFPFALACLVSLRGTHYVHAGSSAACGSNSLGNLSTDETTNVTLGDRWYLLYLPEDYTSSTPAPLILSYHGGNRNAAEQQDLDLLSTPYFNENYVVVYPNGIDVSGLFVCPGAWFQMLTRTRKHGRAFQG